MVYIDPGSELERKRLEVLVVRDILVDALAYDLLRLLAVLLAPLLVLLLFGDVLLQRLLAPIFFFFCKSNTPIKLTTPCSLGFKYVLPITSLWNPFHFSNVLTA